MGCIYKITNTVNGKAYIGQTRHDAEKTRIRDHFTGRGNEDVKKDIEIYGQDAFTFEILLDGIIPELLNSFEKEAIAKFNCVHPNGYNQNRGGRGVISHSDEAKQKISAVHKGKPLSEEHRRKISEANTGKMHTAESRQKMSEANTGKTHSDETKRKISDAHKGDRNHRFSPMHKQTKAFFLSLPASLSKTEKNKRLYDTFPNIHRGTIQRWTRRWQSELDGLDE